MSADISSLLAAAGAKWGSGPQSNKVDSAPGTSFEALLSRAGGEQGVAEQDNGLIRLGSLSRENPTVSHLIMNNPQLREKCWEIVHDPVNRDKPFRDMQRGDTIWIDPQSREIVREAQNPGEARPANDSTTAASSLSLDSGSSGHSFPSLQQPSQDLEQAMQRYMGAPYSRYDCYELVVQGLQDIGLRYYGEEGLQNDLIHSALGEDKSLNANLTGEGLIRSLSERVLHRNYEQVQQPEQKAHELMRSLEEELEQGMLFSVSLDDRGHTGVVSKHEDRWTLINSGRTEYSVRGGLTQHGVDEEDLHRELSKWFRRAGERGQSLSVSLGKLSQERLGQYMESKRLAQSEGI